MNLLICEPAHSRFGHKTLLTVASGYVKIAIENGPVEIVSFPMKHGDFSIVFL